MKKILIVIFGLIIIASCAKEMDNSWQTIKEKGKVVIGIDEFFPPMTFKESNNYVGLDIDLAHAVFKRLGVEIEFKPVLWKDAIIELTNGSIDLIWSGLSINEERRKIINFSIPYIGTRQVIVVPFSSELNTREDLTGKIVGVQKGSTSETAVKNLSDFQKKLKAIKVFSDVETELSALKDGMIDAIVIDEISARYFLRLHHQEFKILSEDLGFELYGVGLRKEDLGLKRRIDRALTKIVKDGTEAKIFKKWLGETQLISEYLRRLKEVKGL